MMIRLHLFLLLFVFHPANGQTQTDALDWNLKVSGVAAPETLTIDWLTKQIEETPKKKLGKKHQDHQHYEYYWKKSGIQVQANQPGGAINSVEFFFKKSKVSARAQSSASPISSLSVEGILIDEQTPVGSFLRGKWNPNAGNGKNLIPTRYFIIDQGTRINAFLNSNRTRLSRVLITFSR